MLIRTLISDDSLFRADLCAKVARDGMADLFLTLTLNEHGWLDITDRISLPDPNRDPVFVCDAPVEVFEQLDRRFKQLMKLALDGKIFGPIDGYCVKIEYQQRGALHYHILFWLVDKSNLCKHVSAVIPLESGIRDKTFSLWSDPVALYQTLRERVLKYQIHRHDQGSCSFLLFLYVRVSVFFNVCLYVGMSCLCMCVFVLCLCVC